MGNHCSAKLAPALANSDACGVLSAVAHRQEPHCGTTLCGDDLSGLGPHGPNVLLLEELVAQSAGSATPRGPVPPWATTSNSPAIDRTATGATPPRSPTPPRAAPPGLPEEDSAARDPFGPAALAAGLDSVFTQDLFRVARSGDAGVLDGMLRGVHGHALALVSKSLGPIPVGAGAQTSADRREKAADMVAAFLSQLRCPVGGPCRETLLGVASSSGHFETVKTMLNARADPAVCDDHGCNALHRAAESGHLLTVLLVLDRLQATSRAVSVTELTNIDGETPEMFAALAGASEVCRAFEVFSDMQNDAEERQLGCSATASDFAGGHRGNNAGSLLAFLELNTESKCQGLATAALLRRTMAGNGLVGNIFEKIPEETSALSELVKTVCRGIEDAEKTLLCKALPNPCDPSLDPTVRAFARTAEARSNWQQIRIEAVREAGCGNDLEEFWQTHLSASMMSTTLMNARGDTFQLLLTVMWLYTREAWLRHVLDTLACAFVAASPQPASVESAIEEGATGATPSLSELPRSLKPLEKLRDALSPLMQLVQSALGWFEEVGIRHSGLTYRPLSLPMLGLQRVIDRYIASRHQKDNGKKETESSRDVTLESDAWVALGAGTFFSAMSSRCDAIKRMTRTRCNVLLFIRPDDQQPCFPKQMSLRGNAVDDVIFPLGTIFRITRITRTVSSDLDPDASRGTNVRWPVMIFELAAAGRFLEIAETIERCGGLEDGQLEAHLKAWISASPPSDKHDRLKAAGEVLMKRSEGASSNGPSKRICLAIEWLDEATKKANEAKNVDCEAQAMLLLAKCRRKQGLETVDDQDGRKAIALLTKAHGANHPETCAARAAWRDLGVS